MTGWVVALRQALWSGKAATGPDGGLPPTRPALTADVPRLDEVVVGDVRGVLLVEVDAGVELLHHLVGEVALDELGRLLHVGTGRVHGLLAGDEGDVAGREDLLVVLERRVVVGLRQLRVG